MTIVVSERGLEFQTFGRSIVVPYERLNHVSLARSDNSLLDFFMLGLRAQGSISRLWGWYLFVISFPIVMFFGTLWAVDGWNEMVASMLNSWRFWFFWWVIWSVIFLGVRFLVVPAMKKMRFKDATLMFEVDPRLLNQQPFTHYRSRPICMSLEAIGAKDRKEIAAALEGNRERLPKNALKVALLHELRAFPEAVDAPRA
jgi:hypothetical protein